MASETKRLARISAAMFAMLIALSGGCGRSNQLPPHELSTARPRIVSLAPSITETLFALGAGSDVVGVSDYCDYPAAALKLPKAGTFLTPNLEAIVALRPTLVIGLQLSSDLREIRALRAMGVSTMMISDDSVARIDDAIRRIGDRLGRVSQATALISAIQLHISAVEQQLDSLPRRPVLMLVGHQPLVAVGRGTFLDELLTLAHSINIADTSWQPWPQLGIEYIIARRPEVILDGAMGTDPLTLDSFWSRYRSIPAVARGCVYGYPQNPTLHSGPRVWQTLDLLARLIHPEAFHPNSSPSPAQEAVR